MTVRKTLLALAAFVASLSLLTGHASANDFDGEEFTSVAMTDAELDQARGAGSSFYSIANMSAALYSNSSTNTTSGENTIGEGALNGFAGLASIVQNSGNNVIIQSSTVVNITFDNQAVTP